MNSFSSTQRAQGRETGKESQYVSTVGFSASHSKHQGNSQSHPHMISDLVRQVCLLPWTAGEGTRSACLETHSRVTLVRPLRPLLKPGSPAGEESARRRWWPRDVGLEAPSWCCCCPGLWLMGDPHLRRSLDPVAGHLG